jgi:hypothetical protein
MIFAVIALIVSGCASIGNLGNGEEETGTELALDETYDRVRNGARLFLTYDPGNNSFNGFVENTTDDALKRVRVEVHLSNGVELGPTTPIDLAPGERKDIKLSAKNFEFDSWTAHPEVGESAGGEHGSGEGEDEHGEEGEGEHNEGGSD